VIYSFEQACFFITEKTTIFWFRRDLRIDDNAALYHALRKNNDVLPVFIFDTEILDKLEDRRDSRVSFILASLDVLRQQLEELGSSLLIVNGNPVDFFRQASPKAVYTNRDYEPYARQRDQKVAGLLQERNIGFHVFKDHVIFEKDEVVKEDGKPYTVFTPYSRKWKAKLRPFYWKGYPTLRYRSSLLKTKSFEFPSLEDIGFLPSSISFPPRAIRKQIIRVYDKQRDFPAIEGTSRLSVHLRFGTVSIRTLVEVAQKENGTWLNELIWRDFYQMILWHFPAVEKAFKPAYDHIRWRNNMEEFEAWCEGRTGYPIVDAGMRELNTTGFMHNRVRMIVASFLTKHLLIDWRWGEAYFAKKLLDFELASNNGGWQWAAGSGCDAAPYFRVFNPELQTQKFDKEFHYIQRWVPEWRTPQYVKPIVEHAFARERAIKTYQRALGKTEQ